MSSILFLIIFEHLVGSTLVDDAPRRMGVPKRMSMQTLKRDLKTCNLFDDLAQNRSKWVANPNVVETRL